MSEASADSYKQDYRAAYDRGLRVSIGAYVLLALAAVVLERWLPWWVFTESGQYFILIASTLLLLAAGNMIPPRYAAFVVRRKCRKTGHAMKEYTEKGGTKLLICERCGDRAAGLK